MNIEQAETDVKQDAAKVEAAIKGSPKWKLIILALLSLFAAAYLAWSLVHTEPPKAGAVIQAAPAVAAAKVSGPTMTVPLKVVPKAAVAKKFPQMKPLIEDAKEEVVDTADIPAEASENGVQTVTFMNVSTGVTSTVYTPKPAPWFALENKNAVGAAYLATTAGPAAIAYVRRDIFRVKDFHVGVVAGAGEVAGKAVAGAGVMGEYRW